MSNETAIAVAPSEAKTYEHYPVAPSGQEIVDGVVASADDLTAQSSTHRWDLKVALGTILFRDPTAYVSARRENPNKYDREYGSGIRYFGGKRIEDALFHITSKRHDTHLGDLNEMLPLIRLAVSAGADPDFPTPRREGGTVLHDMAAYGAANTVALLVKLGAKPDLTDAQGLTPLGVACKALDYEISRTYLSAEADRKALERTIGYLKNLEKPEPTPIGREDKVNVGPPASAVTRDLRL